MKEIIKLENIKRDFKVGDRNGPCLAWCLLHDLRRRICHIMGTSAVCSGKSTLLAPFVS